MGYEWLHGSKASAPEPRRCVSLGKVHPPDLRSIHPALTPHSSLRFHDDFWRWNADRIPELLIGEVVLPEQVDVPP
jgi:hypothetical protein